MTAAAGWLVVAPLGGAVVSIAVGRRWAHLAGTLVAVTCLALSAAIAVEVWRTGRSLEHSVAGWAPPVGILLRADGPAAAMLLLTAVVGAAVTVYSIAYLPLATDATARAWFWPLWLALWTGLNGLFLSGDVFNVFVALELVGLSAVGLVFLAGGRGALVGGTRYLLAAWLGSSTYLIGVALAYGAFDTLDMAQLAERADGRPAAVAALGFATAGLLVKAALFPLHFWLPRAHASAPAPVSAALSALVVTAAFTVIARLWSEALAEAVTPPAGTLVGALGAAAIVWGSLLAICQDRLKLLIAYSTVAQLGYLFLLIPMGAVPLGDPGLPDQAALDAWTGGFYYAVSHGIAKAALFLAAGCLIHAAGSERIVDLAGIAGRLPISSFAFAIAGITLVGLPPSGGFVAKWYLVSAAVRGGEGWWAGIILGGSLLTAVYVLAVVRPAFAQMSAPRETAPVPRIMEICAMGLALVAVILGLRATEGLELLGIGAGNRP